MNPNLKNELEKLHKKLKVIKQTDNDTRNHLENLKSDIENILNNSDKEIINSKEDIISSLRNYTLKFEAEHTEVSESLNIIVHTLSNMGI
jgi:sugar-specific transcriptional regulator TrmB